MLITFLPLFDTARTWRTPCSLAGTLGGWALWWPAWRRAACGPQRSTQRLWGRRSLPRSHLQAGWSRWWQHRLQPGRSPPRTTSGTLAPAAKQMEWIEHITNQHLMTELSRFYIQEGCDMLHQGILITSSSWAVKVRAQITSPLLHTVLPEVCTSSLVRLTPLLTTDRVPLLKVTLQKTCTSSKALEWETNSKKKNVNIMTVFSGPSRRPE